MKSIRDSSPGASGGNDPFADLARAVEGTSLRTPEPEDRPIYGGFEPVEVPQSQWDQFSYQPVAGTGASAERARLATPPLDPYGVIEPVGVSGSRAVQGADPKVSAEADLHIDEALRGLSQPARPRDMIPAETQSFAPARDTEFDHAPHQTITLDDFDELIASELAAMQPSRPRANGHDDYALGFDEADGDFNPDDDYDYQPIVMRSRLRRPLFLLGGVATFVLVGVAGAVVYSGVPGMTGGSQEPLMIRADAEPYKIAPADPGGRSIPNQNKAVYQRVAGGMVQDAPTQQSLVTAMEEPMDIAEEEDPPVEDLPGVSVGGDLAMPAGDGPGDTEVAEADEPSTLQPRKVRTLTVRPDGTLVANESPAMAGGEPAMLTASNTLGQSATLDPVAGIQPALPFATDNPDLTTASTAAPLAAPAPVAEPAAPAPPVAARPAPVAAPAPQRTAALEPASAPEASDGYFVQISSQPSEDLARQSQANLSSRYASVIGGRGVGIKAAEIPGKGTFYRVRVSAASKSEANTLCASLKSAGGSCFVTR